jgi:hypothetical protein
MGVDLYTKTILTAIAILLGVLVVRPFFLTAPVSAQAAGSAYGSLVPEDGNTHIRFFVDLRNGKLWDCNLSDCALAGQFPLDKTRCGREAPLPDGSDFRLNRYSSPSDSSLSDDSSSGFSPVSSASSS